MANRRVVLFAVVAVAVLAAGGAGFALFGGSKPAPVPPSRTGDRAAAEELLAEQRVAAATTRLVALSFPTNDDSAAPVWSPAAFGTPLARHVVFGFAPYYSLGELTAADYADTSTIAYDGLDLLAGGGLDERSSDPGWQVFSSPAFASLVSHAHAAKDQVLLTVFTETASVIRSITKQPATAGAKLAGQLQPLLADDGLDGVDIDVEGSGPAERPGFLKFMQAFTAHLRATDPSAYVVVDVYPGSAGDSQSFFNVKALAPLVDTMFVMAYDMYQSGVASPNAPLTSPDLGLSDVQCMLRYVKVVPPNKLILGVPFYGYDFTTESSSPGAATRERYPLAVTWQSIVAAGHAPLWDPASDTPWYRFRVKHKGPWHETYFDDPASIALKTALASYLHLQGVGVWSLGMESGDDSMLDALLGGSSPKKLPLSTSTVLDKLRSPPQQHDGSA